MYTNKNPNRIGILNITSPTIYLDLDTLSGEILMIILESLDFMRLKPSLPAMAAAANMANSGIPKASKPDKVDLTAVFMLEEITTGIRRGDKKPPTKTMVAVTILDLEIFLTGSVLSILLKLK